MRTSRGPQWCVSDADCAGRAKSPLGSSSAWSRGTVTCPDDTNAPVCYADGGAAGMISNDPAVNPLANNWNKVFFNCAPCCEKWRCSAHATCSPHPRASAPAPHTHAPARSADCDGGSYAGGVLAPQQVGADTIYYRGRYILDAVYATLATAGFGLRAATSLVVKGCSAGGLAVYLHADYVAGLMRAIAPAARVLAAPGAGLFLDVPGFDGGYHYRDNYAWVFSRMNASAGVNADCVAATPPADAARCFNAAYTIPFVKTPLFISNSLADSWQAGNIMALPCNPGGCGGDKAKEAAVEAYLAAFRGEMVAALAPVLSSKRHGGFLQSCFVHVVEDIDGSFARVRINNATRRYHDLTPARRPEPPANSP